jgi:hypothetical protein
LHQTYFSDLFRLFFLLCRNRKSMISSMVDTLFRCIWLHDVWKNSSMVYEKSSCMKSMNPYMVYVSYIMNEFFSSLYVDTWSWCHPWFPTSCDQIHWNLETSVHQLINSSFMSFIKNCSVDQKNFRWSRIVPFIKN